MTPAMIHKAHRPCGLPTPKEFMSTRKRRDIPRFQTPLIETHCHLDYLDDSEIAEAIAQAQDCGIEKLVTIAVSPDNLATVMTLIERHPAVWGTQGIHPHEAEHFSAEVARRISENLQHPRVLAVGEIGLDYYYDHADRGRQREVFREQLQIAADNDLPVVIHSREADEDTQRILADFLPTLSRRGVIHSFTSGPALAEFCLEAGFMLGFNGIVTFKSAENVRDIVAMTPVERILLETDSPYLTPVPYRGRPNSPRYLPFVAEKVAEIKGLDVESLLQQARRNSEALLFSNSGTEA
jgi:TatD DNase family protein